MGEFNEGIRDGLGKYTFQNGDQYMGEWSENRKDGTGMSSRTVERGGELAVEEYKGEREGDKKNGRGIYKFANGDIYFGDWKFIFFFYDFQV